MSADRDLLLAARNEPRDYADALAVLRSIRVRGRTQTYDVIRAEAEPLVRFRYWLLRLGYKPEDLNALSCIHLTGSKGKGSIASFCSALLTGLAPGAKVGRYTSPQLVHDRERISINGEPIPEEMFAKYLFELWDRLAATNSRWEPRSHSRPSYFWLLTLMSFHVFIKEKVDIAIIEVGAGGYADCTNIIPRPLVSAIGSIGLAHVGEIGNNTLEIAQDKAGIYKAGCPALTLVQEEHSVMRALESAAHRAGCSSFTVVPRLKWLEKLDSIGLAGPHQVNNASLALYIVQAALSSPRCPPAFQQAAKEMQDPRYRPPIIVQPDQPKPWHVKMPLPGLQMVAKDPRLAFNLLAFLILGTYYAAQHCARLYSEGGWPAVQPVAPVYVSATILTYLAVSERYRKSRRRGYWDDDGGSRGTGRLPSLGLSPSLRCGKVFRALAKTRWPGRAEVLRDPASSAVLYLDCAHTPESLELASRWFSESSGCSTVKFDKEPTSPDRSGFVTVPAPQPHSKRERILVFTLPDGVASPYSLLEKLLQGCSTLDAAGVSSISFDRVIIASDEVVRRGDFVKNADLTRQTDLLKLWMKMVPNSKLSASVTEGQVGISVAATVEDVREQVRLAAKKAEGRGNGCDVLVTGSIFLVGYVYELFELPLLFTAKE